jgi:hypothetical protein
VRVGWWWWVPAIACGARCVCVRNRGLARWWQFYRCGEGRTLGPFRFAPFGNSGVLIVSPICLFAIKHEIFFDKFKRIGNRDTIIKAWFLNNCTDSSLVGTSMSSIIVTGGDRTRANTHQVIPHS